MIARPLWLNTVCNAWSRRSIVWLSGVRGAGKTMLGRMIADAARLNCDLPSVQRKLKDPETAFRALLRHRAVVIDEVHRLDDPGGVLEVVGDRYPDLRVLAAGTPTATATKKLADAHRDRVVEVHLCPVPWQECLAFSMENLDRRLLHGGLPEALLAARKDPDFFSGWIDAFYARDVLALFNTRNRRGFLELFRVLLRESGDQLDFGRLASMSGQSRPTVSVHLEALRVLGAIRLVRPFHGERSQEIVSRPRCYAFDTGFVTFERGWRDEDRGLLWKHLVLDELRLQFRENSVRYWRDKSRREVDFVIQRGTGDVDLVACEIDPYALDPGPAELFRSRYAKGANYIVTPAVRSPYRIQHGSMTFTVCSTPYPAAA